MKLLPKLQDRCTIITIGIPFGGFAELIRVALKLQYFQLKFSSYCIFFLSEVVGINIKWIAK